MSLALALGIVVFLSAMAFWHFNAALFMLAAGASIMLGFQWYDVYVTNAGLGISLMLIIYSFVCLGFAFTCLFKGGRSNG